MRTTAPLALPPPAFDAAGCRLHLFELLEQNLPLAGQLVAGLTAHEQSAASALLDLEHAPANGRRAKSERLCGAREPTGARHTQEAAINVPIHVFHW